MSSRLSHLCCFFFLPLSVGRTQNINGNPTRRGLSIYSYWESPPNPRPSYILHSTGRALLTFCFSLSRNFSPSSDPKETRPGSTTEGGAAWAAKAWRWLRIWCAAARQVDSTHAPRRGESTRRSSLAGVHPPIPADVLRRAAPRAWGSEAR